MKPRERSVSQFGLEQELVLILRRQLHRVFGHGFIFAQSECPLGRRVADIAVCSFNDKRATARLPSAIARLSALDAHLLAGILTGRRTMRQLASQSYLSADATDARLGRLVRLGLVKMHRTRYAPTGWEAHLPAALYAIEAKLSNWREAVAQASYYRQFVDKAYVALPESFRHVPAISRECTRAGIGLILVSTSGGVDAVLQARSSSRIPPRRTAFAVASLCRLVLKEGHAGV